MALNVITASFSAGQRKIYTIPAVQWDYGQILKFDGITLPVAYEVHFSNDPESGNTITQIGDADGVTIPDQFFKTGSTIYCWVYLHEGADDGETEYMVVIPIKQRPKPSNTEPTPVQQDAITEAIAALNDAVEDAQTLANEWENMSATAETLPSGSSATASYSEGTLTLGIPRGDTGAQGEQGIQGIPGKDGQDGAPGVDGVSPTVSVESITGGHEVTITDANGEHSFDVMDGEQGAPGQDGSPGADGYSPTATVTKSGDTATITITDKNGTTTATVSDGQTGQTGPAGPGVPTGGTTGQVLKKNSNTDFDAIWANESGAVTDVQINGTSILSQGVANIPIGSSSALGTFMTYPARGITNNGTTGQMYINKASNDDVKAGTNDYKPVVPSNESNAVFYGMAKAAGDSTQSASANAVGTYTEDAKSKISDMLNAPETVSGSTPSITAKSGIRYVCGEVSTLDIVVPASGLFEVDFESGSTATVLTTTGTTVTWPSWFDPTSLEASTLYEISIQDGKGLVATWPA